MTGAGTGHAFINGDNTGEGITGTLQDFSNSEDVFLGTNPRFLPDDSFSGWIRTVAMFQPTRPDADRIAWDQRLADRYGVTF